MGSNKVFIINPRRELDSDVEFNRPSEGTPVDTLSYSLPKGNRNDLIPSRGGGGW